MSSKCFGIKWKLFTFGRLKKYLVYIIQPRTRASHIGWNINKGKNKRICIVLKSQDVLCNALKKAMMRNFYEAYVCLKVYEIAAQKILSSFSCHDRNSIMPWKVSWLRLRTKSSLTLQKFANCIGHTVLKLVELQSSCSSFICVCLQAWIRVDGHFIPWIWSPDTCMH